MLSSNFVCTAVVYATGGLCQVGILPWFVLPLVLLTVFSRWTFSIHPRTHFKGRYTVVEELMLLLLSPLSLGLTEQRAAHLRHHTFLDSPLDPDWLFYQAHPFVSFLLCCFHPEITFCRELQSMSLGALGRCGLRLVLFTALLLVAGTNFLLWYLLPIRILFAIAQFIFTWALHHRQEERTIDIHLPPGFTLLLGRAGMRELSSHAEHHKGCHA